MEQEIEKEAVLSAVGNALMDKGAGYSVGELVADLEGDGIEHDPYQVRDRHFLRDVQEIDEWRDEPRDLEDVETLLALFAEYFSDHPDRRFCEVVCNAHVVKNGIEDFEDDGTHYKEPLGELTDSQLRAYLEWEIENADA